MKKSVNVKNFRELQNDSEVYWCEFDFIESHVEYYSYSETCAYNPKEYGYVYVNGISSEHLLAHKITPENREYLLEDLIRAGLIK